MQGSSTWLLVVCSILGITVRKWTTARAGCEFRILQCDASHILPVISASTDGQRQTPVPVTSICAKPSEQDYALRHCELQGWMHDE